MNGHYDITNINQEIAKAAKDLVAFCSSMTDAEFFRGYGEKWSAAQQVKHLVKATRTSTFAYTFPKWVVRFAGGKPNRLSRTYEALVDKYTLKLKQGGKSTGRYIPKPINATYGRERLLNEYAASMNRLAKAMVKNFNDDQLDKYIIPHPLLGRITLRELGYFTIHHSYHHLDSIRERNAS